MRRVKTTSNCRHSGTLGPPRTMVLALIVALAIGCSGAPTITSAPASPSAPGTSGTPTGSTRSIQPTASLAPGETAAPTFTTPEPTVGTEPTATPSDTTLPASPTAPPAATLPTPGTEGWLEPTQISDRWYRQPSMVVDQNGVAHIAGVIGDEVYYVTNGSGQWIREAVGSPPAREQNDSPSIAVDPADGSLTIAYSRRSSMTVPNFSNVSYSVTNASGSWSNAEQLPTGGEDPKLVTRNGLLFLGYNDQESDGAEDLDDVTRPVYGSDAGGEWLAAPLADIGRVLALHVAPEGPVQVLLTSWQGGQSNRARVLLGQAGMANNAFEFEQIPDVLAQGWSFSGGFGENGLPFLSWNTLMDDVIYTFTRQGSNGWSEPRAGVAYAVDSRDVAHVLDFEALPQGTRVTYWAHGSGDSSSHELVMVGDYPDATIALDDSGRPHIFISSDAGTYYAVGPASN